MLQAHSILDKAFTGQEHIDELVLIDFNAKMYATDLGMMLQANTIIPDGPVTQSLNRYAYVFNNPLSYTDSSGHIPLRDRDKAEEDFDEYKNRKPRAYRVKNKKDQKYWKKKLEEKGYKVITGVVSTSIISTDTGGTFRGQGNGLGGDSFNGEDLDKIRNRYNLSSDFNGGNSFRTGRGIIQGMFGSHNIGENMDVDLWGDIKGAARFLNPFQDLSEWNNNGCGVLGWIIEMTPGGGWLDKQNIINEANSPLSRDEALKVWDRLSEKFSNGASGNAVGYVKDSWSGSTFNRIEYPVLIKNNKITNVITGGN